MKTPIYVTSVVPVHVAENYARQLDLLYNPGTAPPPSDTAPILHTHTKVWESDEMWGHTSLTAYLERISLLTIRCEQFLAEHPERDALYKSFTIPKRTGGLRKIDAPIEDLKILQREIVFTLSHLPGHYHPFVHAHDTAYAYITGRSTVDALRVHQANDSHWYLKLDIKSFFPNCIEPTVVTLLRQVYPLCYIPPAELCLILRCCMLKGSLPQGAVSSPFLTNIMMIPIDKAINDLVFNWDKRHVVYTRYADDLLFSAKESFGWQQMCDEIKDILFRYSFELNEDKTRYGSRAGRNWNLGLLINQTNQISLGHNNKQRLRAMLWNFLKDTVSEVHWDLADIQYLQGMLSYWAHIEPEYVESIKTKYQSKAGITFSECLERAMLQALQNI